MKVFKTVAIGIPFLGLAGLVIWQQAQLRHLRAESVTLREQLAQTMADQEKSELLVQTEPNLGQPPAEAPSSELLRLRGEVGVLRRQLAEASGSGTGRQPTLKSAELEPPPQPQLQTKVALEALEARLKAQEQEVVAAKQKVADLLAALKVPEEIWKLDAATALGRDDLQAYRAYFEAKRGLEGMERFTQLLGMKLRQEHQQAGDPLPGGASQ